MSKMLFARIQAEVNLPLRRGAWYRVLQLSPLQALIEVNRRPVPVLRAMLEINARPPLRWSVVRRTSKRARPDGAYLGAVYGVCPYCRTRSPLTDKIREQACRHCKGTFAVAWGEGYLQR